MWPSFDDCEGVVETRSRCLQDNESKKSESEGGKKEGTRHLGGEWGKQAGVCSPLLRV